MKICPTCACRHAAPGWRCPACGAIPPTVNGIPRVGCTTDAIVEENVIYRRTELMEAEQWHFWFRARRRLVLWSIERFFPGNASLLDVGCGTGFVLEGVRARHPEMALAGCDVADDMAALTSRRVPDALVFGAMAAALPFEEEFGMITALDVIEHIDDDRAALAGMYRALRPGGGLVLTVPQHPSLWSRVDDFSGHHRRYTRAELMDKVRTAGFEFVRNTSFFTTTLPIIAASRRRPARRAFDPLAELRIPRSVNRLLDWLMMCEEAVIRWGVSLPVGGSLLLVARRPRP